MPSGARLATFDVSFDANGGTGSMAQESSNVSKSLTANAFARVGFTFQSWNTAANGSGTSYANGATYPFAEDVTLYAQWVNNTVLPGAPTVTSLLGGNRAVTVGWTAPGSNGGSAITAYTVTSSPGGYTCVTATTSCTVAGLTNGTSYTFSVVAANGNGIGPASAASSAVTPATYPGVAVRVIAVAGRRSAVVTWRPPANNGGATVTGYVATSRPGGRTCRTTTATRCRVAGLVNGTRYRISVVAVNRVGKSTVAALSGIVIPHVAGHRVLHGFAEGSIRISAGLRVGILRLARLIKADGDKRILLFGFTDDGGTAASRVGISLLRARRVEAVLLGDLARLKVRGLSVRVFARGAARPLASNRTPAGRAKNRRVLVVFV